jgi:formylglycine-generating enzyme required for sulfatase activity
MAKYEVTQRQYQELIGSNPSYFKGEDLPVTTVSWRDAIKFCDELTKESFNNKLYKCSVTS